MIGISETTSPHQRVRASPLILSNIQKLAYRDTWDWIRNGSSRERYIAGFAGTGKSTIAASLIHRLEASGSRVCVATYTGKAASVLRRKGIGQAGTIHSLIYEREPGSEPPRWYRSPNSPLADAALLVVDEVSMCGDELVDDLRSYGKKILVLGDPGQLPPINGAGAFTRREPDVMLTEIHRQAAGSPILAMATDARLGRPLSTDGDRARILERSTTNLLDARGQVLCGTHRSRWAATKLLRGELGYMTPSPCVGERVICRRNDRDLGIFNGMLGTVERRYEDDDEDYVRFGVRMDDTDELVDVASDATLFREHSEGRVAPPYYARGIQLFDFGYVITVHSAQGSEWDDVTVIDDSGSFGDDRDRWLYTAITRASDRVTILRRVR